MEPARIAWAVLSSSLFISEGAFAKGIHDTEHGWYAGIGDIITHYDLTVAEINSYVYSVQEPSATRVDAAANGFSAFAGFRHNRFIGIEVGYADFGTMSYHLGNRTGPTIIYCGATPCAPSPRRPPSDFDIRLSGPFVRARPTVPVGSRFMFEGHIGWDFTKFDSAGGVGERTSFHSPGLSVGGGFSFAITRQLRAALQWDKFSSIGRPFVYGGASPYANADTYRNDVDFRALGITLDYRF